MQRGGLMLTFDVSELAKLADRFKDIEEKVAKKALRTAARKAMQIVRNDVKANAPEDTSDDADDIKTKTHISMQTSFRQDTLYVRVGVKGGARKNPDSPWYWRMVEFGTKHISAKPFMAPALENNADAVLERLTQELKREIDKV